MAEVASLTSSQTQQHPAALLRSAQHYGKLLRRTLTALAEAGQELLRGGMAGGPLASARCERELFLVAATPRAREVYDDEAGPTPGEQRAPFACELLRSGTAGAIRSIGASGGFLVPCSKRRVLSPVLDDKEELGGQGMGA